jgi:hypothetical protein
MIGMTHRFSYLGYDYYTDEDRDDDNCKLLHYCYKDGRKINMPPGFYNYTPYENMAYSEFVDFIQDVEVFVQG